MSLNLVVGEREEEIDDPNKDIKSIWRNASQASHASGKFPSNKASKWLGQTGVNAVAVFTPNFEGQDRTIPGLANTVNTNRDSYQVLPTKLRTADKFQWVNPGDAKSKTRGGKVGKGGENFPELGSYYRPGSSKLVETGYNERGRGGREAYVPPVLRESGGGGENDTHNGSEKKKLAMVFGEEIGG